MYLSKLEIFGLKSFAHKVHFEFTDGITAIIGPNGCGKSNIVDAIRWVLGEQRPSLLRLDRMENIIFNGTATRKPLSLAEVSMTIENTKNILPSIYSEVKITRRLYRSGESEYLLNNRQVRLKDIIDLFADTGMGADAYSVIELKMVEQILSDNAEERRRLFEEAAGIKKYKYRRKAALRKMEMTEQELLRLNDVIGEVQKTVNSLSRQVGKARRYHKFKDELKEKEIYIFQLKSQTYQQDLIPLQEEFRQVRQTRERLGSEINRDEAELEKLQAKSVDLEHAFREVTGRLSAADEQIRTLQQKVQLNDQRIESLRQNIENARSEISEHQSRILSLGKQMEEVKAEKAEVVKLTERKNRDYIEKANIQTEAENRLNSLRQKYQQFREENVNTLNEVSRRREEFQRVSIQKNNLAEQQERLAALQTGLQEDLQQKQSALDGLRAELETARQDGILYEKEQHHLQKQIDELAEELPALELQRNQLLGSLEKEKSQKEFLNRLIHNYSGFSEGVQYVMSNKKHYTGLIDTLANLIDTREEYRPALESYLEGIANYLIVEEVETAQNILSQIRSRKKGRLTVVPLSILHTSRNGVPDFSKLNSDIIPLKKVVSYDTRYEKLFSFLFERVLLVKDIDTALRWHRKYPDCNFLTHEGELLGEWGNITGGNSHQNLNLTGRKQQLERSGKEVARLNRALTDVEQKIEMCRQKVEERKKKLEEFTGLLGEQQNSINGLQQQVNQREYETEHSRRRLAETGTELETMHRRIEELQSREQALLPSVEEADRKQQAFREQESTLSEQVEQADRKFRALSREVQQAQIEYLNRKSRLNELEQKTEYLKQTLLEAEQQISRANIQIEHYREEIQRLETENKDFRQQLDGLYQNRDRIEKEKLEVEQNYQSLKSLILAREEEVKKLHRRWNQALDRLKEVELKIREIEIKQQTQREQMEERFGSELEALVQKNPVPPEVSIQQLQENISQLRQKVEALGEVNPLAVKEYDREKERLDFLKAQLADLLEAKKELVETITKLNKTARKLFLDTFEKIHQNFKSVFGKFFEGGEAELHLVDSADPLDTNIDISVRIKGRKLSTLSLMSAGEKTLTAISLLFAIYLVKPSPFCIFDEVDAPLDDVNISRYTNAIKEFSRNTQFILVTHNKMTMQAAKAIYGITMEEPGVSKVVSVRFD